MDTGESPGDIVFNYVDLDSGDGNANGATSTVGIKNAGAQGPDRVLVSFDMLNPLVHGGQAILITAARTGGQPDTEEPGKPHGQPPSVTDAARLAVGPAGELRDTASPTTPRTPAGLLALWPVKKRA